jgi:predicted RNA methylase
VNYNGGGDKMPSFISFIPTPQDDVDGFFELAPVLPTDVVYDLGSGDGRLLFSALAKGATRAVGIELNHTLVQDATAKAEQLRFANRVKFLEADVMDINLTDASLVLCYLISRASEVLKDKFAAELKAGTRVVMESFPVPGWVPQKTIYRGNKTFYLYTMPPSRKD